MTALSYANGKVLWAEQGYHPRWRNETYSEIVSYNINLKKKKRLTRKSRYFSPSFSPSGNRIVAIKINENLSQSISVLDGQSGTETNKIYKASDSELSFPKYLDESTVVFIQTINQKTQIVSIDVNSLLIKPLTERSDRHLSHLYINEGQLYVSLASQYTNDIYHVDINNGNLTKLTSAPLGAFQPAVKENKLFYSEFSYQGYNVNSTKIRGADNLRDQETVYSNTPPFYPSLIQSNEVNFLDEVPNKKYPIKKFNKLSGIFNFHSLIPEWQPPEVSLSLLSDNTFSTLSASILGKYNYNENTFRYGVGLQYAAWYPIVNVSYFKTNRDAVFYNFAPSTDSSLVREIVIDRWNENRATVGFSLPYNFSKGSNSNRFNLSLAYQNTGIKLKDPIENRVVDIDTTVVGQGNLNRFESIFKDPISDQTIHTLDVGIGLSMLKFRALQHLRPRVGFSMAMRYRANIGTNELGGNTFSARGIIYLPGFSKNHSFSVDAMIVNEDILSSYRYSDLFIYPRGYDFTLRRDKFLKVGFNYRFPIAYPDWPIGGFAFVKRLKGNAFFDFGRFGITSFPFEEQYTHVNSLGFELGVDVRVLRLLEIDFGVRYSYLLNEDFAGNSQHQFDFFVISITE